MIGTRYEILLAASSRPFAAFEERLAFWPVTAVGESRTLVQSACGFMPPLDKFTRCIVTKIFRLTIVLSAALLLGSVSWGQTARRITRDDAVKDAPSLAQHTNIALLVAIGDYDRAVSGLPPLKYPVADITPIASALKKDGFEISILTDRSATAGAVREAIGELGKALDKGQGTFLFYFSGHGFRTGTENYLATFGTTASDLANQGLSVSELEKLLVATGAKRRMAFIDACRNDPEGARAVAGAGARPRSFGDLKDSEGLRVMYSTAPGEVSYEDEELQHGVFSYFLLDGLNGKAAKPDGLITFDDLFGYVTKQMKSYGIAKRRVQTPYQSGESTGDFLLAAVNTSGATSATNVVTPPPGPKIPDPGPATPPQPAPSTGTPAADSRGIGALKNETGSLDALPQIWRNTSSNDYYRLKFDSDHLIIYQMRTNAIIADLSLKKDKKDSKKDKYVGHTSLSRCRNGEMEVLSWSPTRIEARIEVPDAQNACNQAGGALRLGALFKSWANASFIPETPGH